MVQSGKSPRIGLGVAVSSFPRGHFTRGTAHFGRYRDYKHSSVITFFLHGSMLRYRRMLELQAAV